MWKPEQQRIRDLRVTLSAVRDLARSAPRSRRKTLTLPHAIEQAADRALTRDTANEMPRDGKTYAIRKVSYALVDPKGVPVSLHTSLTQAVGHYAGTRKPKDLIIDEASRQRIFEALNRNRWSIARCYAWVRVSAGDKIKKLPPEKS